MRHDRQQDEPGHDERAVTDPLDLVDPAAKQDLRTPVDGYVNASDPKTIMFGKLNALYAEPGKGITPETYNAPVGFIEE